MISEEGNKLFCHVFLMNYQVPIKVAEYVKGDSHFIFIKMYHLILAK